MPISFVNVVNVIPMSPNKNGSEQVGNEPVTYEIPSSYAIKLSPTSLTKANLRKIDAIVSNDADYDVWLPLDSVHKFSSTEGIDSVLRDGPWMIRGIPIFLNKWSPSVSLLKDDLSRVPVWVKFHDVPLVAYTSDGFSLIATKIALNVNNPIIEEVVTGSEATTSGTQEEGHSSTPIVEKINVLVIQIREGNLCWWMMMGNLRRWLIIRLIQTVMMMLNLLKMKLQIFLTSKGVGYGPKSLWEQWRDTTVDIEYDPYDDDMYESRKITENIQTIWDHFDINVHGRKMK
ncbi:primary amine oxidase-like protein [Tanacetum coccineum]